MFLICKELSQQLHYYPVFLDEELSFFKDMRKKKCKTQKVIYKYKKTKPNQENEKKE